MHPSPAPAPSVRPRGLVLRGRVWNGREPARPGWVVLDASGTIAAINPAEAAIPADLPKLGDDRSWIGPGIVDAHVHLAFGSPQDMRRGGVVAVRDLGAPLPDAMRWKRHGSGLVVAVSGPIVTAPGGYPTNGWGANGFGRGVARRDEVAALMAELAGARVDVVKIALEPSGGQPVPPSALARSVVDAAHDAGLAVVAHALTAAMVERALDAGVDELAHTPVEPLPDRLVERIAAAEVTVTSTLHALAGYPGSAVRENAAALVAAGVRLAYGTDLGNAGTRTGAEPNEIELLAEAGLGMTGAVRAATEIASGVAGLRDRRGLGRIAVGAPAALVLLPGDPHEDAERWRHPQAVIIGTDVSVVSVAGAADLPPASLGGSLTGPRGMREPRPADERVSPRAILTDYRMDAWVALGVIALSLAVGALMGLVWEAIATPAIEVVTDGVSGGSIFNDRNSERWTSADGWFAALAAIAGLLCGGLAYARFRRHGVGVAVGSAIGGLAASVLASQVGEALGPDPVSAHLGEPPGTQFTGPLVVHASAVLFVWPIAALVLIMALTAAAARRP